jgi:hypothetical protein
MTIEKLTHSRLVKVLIGVSTFVLKQKWSKSSRLQSLKIVWLATRRIPAVISSILRSYLGISGRLATPATFHALRPQQNTFIGSNPNLRPKTSIYATFPIVNFK